MFFNLGFVNEFYISMRSMSFMMGFFLHTLFLLITKNF